MATEAQITIRFGYTNKRYFILKHFQVYKYNNILRLFFDKQITIFIFLQIFEKSINEKTAPLLQTQISKNPKKYGHS